ncbi:unnamed protein product [Ectocarpus fasciculatus]
MPSAQTGPKNGTLVHQYRRAKTNPEDSPMDYFSILAVLSGTACMFYEWKLLAWLSLFLSMSSIMNMKSVDRDLKQIVSALMFSVVGLFMRYFSPVRQQRLG